MKYKSIQFSIIHSLSFFLCQTHTVLENEKLPDRLTETACDIMNLFGSQAEFEECKDTFNCKRPRIHDSLKTDVKSSQSSPNLCPKNVQNVNLNVDENRASSSANLQSTSRNSSNSSINSNKKGSPVNDLLNLNLNNPQPSPNSNPRPTNQNNDQSQPTIPCDLLGNFNLKNIDLLNDLSGDKSSPHQRSTNTSNLDLLNELFHNQTKQNNQAQSNPLPTSGPDLLVEPNVRPNGAYANESSSSKSNNIDPFDVLFSSPNATSTKSNGLRFPLSSTQPPLKPTQTKPTTSNASIPNNKFPTTASSNSSAFKQQSKPDYNRAYFNEQQAQASSANNGSKLSDDAFGDLLRGFSKNPQNDWNKNSGKSMAQLKREEMVGLKTNFFHLN